MPKLTITDQWDWDHRYEREAETIPGAKSIDHKWRVDLELPYPDGGFNAGIHLVSNRKDRRVAVRKVLKPHHKLGTMTEQWRREMLMMRRFNHPNIPFFVEGWCSDKGGSIYMEPCRFGNANDFSENPWPVGIKPRFRELIVWYMMREIATAVLYLQTGFRDLEEANDARRSKKRTWITAVHGDIRPDQVFFTDPISTNGKPGQGPPRVLLGDLGATQFIRPGNVTEAHDGGLKRMGGSKPPEFPQQISPFTDIYDIGAFAWLFLSPNLQQTDMFEDPPSGLFIQYDVGYELDSLLTRCLRKNPNERPTIRLLLDVCEKNVKQLEAAGEKLKRFRPDKFLTFNNLW